MSRSASKSTPLKLNFLNVLFFGTPAAAAAASTSTSACKIQFQIQNQISIGKSMLDSIGNRVSEGFVNSPLLLLRRAS